VNEYLYQHLGNIDRVFPVQDIGVGVLLVPGTVRWKAYAPRWKGGLEVIITHQIDYEGWKVLNDRRGEN